LPLKHLVLVLVINLAWAFNFIAGKSGADYFGPFLATALRFSVVLVIFSPFLFRVRKHEIGQFLLIGVTMGILHFGLVFYGFSLASDISSLAILSQLHVPFVVLLGVFFLRERVGLWRSSGIVLAFAGVLFVGFDPLVLQHPGSVIVMAFAAMMLSTSHVLMRRIPEADPWALLGWIAVIATLGHSCLSLLFESGQWLAITQATLWSWSSILYAGIGGTIIGHGLSLLLIQRYPVSTVNPFLLLTPLFAVVMGIVIWGDEPGWRLWVGGAFVLSGVAVIAFRQKAIAQK
jgi:O-acetylserine/cysteine efflux transporter